MAEIDGLRETVDALRRLPAALSGRNGGPVRAALFQAARVIQSQAIENAPRDRGNLKRAIRIVRDRNPAATGANERYSVFVKGSRKVARGARRRGSNPLLALSSIGGNAYYWFMVEFGTSKQPPQRFMTRAFESERGRAIVVFSDALAKFVAQAERKAAKEGFD